MYRKAKRDKKNADAGCQCWQVGTFPRAHRIRIDTIHHDHDDTKKARFKNEVVFKPLESYLCYSTILKNMRSS